MVQVPGSTGRDESSHAKESGFPIQYVTGTGSMVRQRSLGTTRGHTREAQFVANSSVPLDELGAEGVPGDDDLLQLRIERLIREVFDDLIKGLVR
jgi:hypothetical protein